MRKNCENGRSMVEMLGVLAIIGVLSVGGIVGYSKAMHKHKMNKTINQISHLIVGITSFYANQDNFEGVSAHTLKTAGLLPDDLLILDEREEEWGESKHTVVDLQNAFGGNVYITTHDEAAQIVFYNIPQDICPYLYSYDWSSFDNIRGIAYGGSTTGFSQNCENGTSVSGRATIASCQLPVPVAEAAQYCANFNFVGNFQVIIDK